MCFVTVVGEKRLAARKSPLDAQSMDDQALRQGIKNENADCYQACVEKE